MQKCVGFIAGIHLTSHDDRNVTIPTRWKNKSCLSFSKRWTRRFSPLPFTCSTTSETRQPTLQWKDRQQLLSTEIPKLQGEWIGYSATYEMDTGKVESVPEKWVPDAFIDWGVIVKGLEHMTSATLDNDLLYMKETLILPKVGCEEDAVAVDVAVHQIPYKSHTLVPFLDGSFSYGPASLQQDGKKPSNMMMANMVFFDATASEKENRGWTRLGITASFATNKIHLVKEEWNLEYNGGQVLIGCGGNIQPFDDDQRLDPSDLLQFQRGNKITWSANSNAMAMEQDTDCAVPWTVDKILFDWYLPVRAHVRCFYGAGNRFCFQTGWLATPSQYFLISREYDDQQQFVQATWFASKMDA